MIDVWLRILAQKGCVVKKNWTVQLKEKSGLPEENTKIHVIIKLRIHGASSRLFSALQSIFCSMSSPIGELFCRV